MRTVMQPFSCQENSDIPYAYRASAVPVRCYSPCGIVPHLAVFQDCMYTQVEWSQHYFLTKNLFPFSTAPS